MPTASAADLDRLRPRRHAQAHVRRARQARPQSAPIRPIGDDVAESIDALCSRVAGARSRSARPRTHGWRGWRRPPARSTARRPGPRRCAGSHCRAPSCAHRSSAGRSAPAAIAFHQRRPNVPLPASASAQLAPTMPPPTIATSNSCTPLRLRRRPSRLRSRRILWRRRRQHLSAAPGDRRHHPRCGCRCCAKRRGTPRRPAGI